MTPSDTARRITAETGLSMKDSVYEVGRAYDVFTLSGQMAIRDDSEIFSCDITPHGKQRRIYTMRQPLLGVRRGGDKRHLIACFLGPGIRAALAKLQLDAERPFRHWEQSGSLGVDEPQAHPPRDGSRDAALPHDGIRNRLAGVFRNDFDFEDVHIKLATRPEKRVGADELWDKAEHACMEALRRSVEAAKSRRGSGNKSSAEKLKTRKADEDEDKEW